MARFERWLTLNQSETKMPKTYDGDRSLTAGETKTLEARMQGVERSLLGDIAMASEDENIRQKVDELLALTKLIHDDQLAEALEYFRERQRRKIIRANDRSMYPKFISPNYPEPRSSYSRGRSMKNASYRGQK